MSAPPAYTESRTRKSSLRSMCRRPLAITVAHVELTERAESPSSPRRKKQRPVWYLDAALAAPLAITILLSTHRVGPDPDPIGAPAIALVLIATLPYFARRTAPLPVLLISLPAAAALYIAGYNPGSTPFLVAIGAYTVAAYRPLREVVIAAVFINACLLVMLVGDSPAFGVPDFASSAPIYIALILVGWSMQQRRLRYEAFEREQDLIRERAVADERLRIAQELHDVIGHSLGVIAVQAGVGMHMIDSDPDEAKRALEHISRTSRTSLGEIRRLLGLVRAGEGAAAYAPTPGLGDLPALAADVTAAGLPVTLAIAPEARDLPAGVELSAYRIVQEALTNARKHGGARRANVEVTVDGGMLRVVVDDDGNGATSSNGGGHGLVGMRERVAVYGGSLDTGPTAEGGYRVDAALPFEELG